MAIWSFRVGRHPEILLAATHFLSKNNSSSDDQSLLAGELAKEIVRVEASVGHERTLVVGDFNMNPFETGIIGLTTLHAVMTKKLAERAGRVVQGTSRGPDTDSSTIPCGDSSEIARWDHLALTITVLPGRRNCSGTCSIKFCFAPPSWTFSTISLSLTVLMGSRS